MLREATKHLGIYLVSKSQHHAMNTLMNMRYTIQKKLEPILGQYRVKKCAGVQSTAQPFASVHSKHVF